MNILILDFLSEFFYIYIKEFKIYVLLEWKGIILDLDMKYEIVEKNIFGYDKVVYRLLGLNLLFYIYLMINFVIKNIDSII